MPAQGSAGRRCSESGMVGKQLMCGAQATVEFMTPGPREEAKGSESPDAGTAGIAPSPATSVLGKGAWDPA